MKRCYYDGDECDCDAFDVAGSCPRDDLYHDDDQDDYDTDTETYIDAAYQKGTEDDYTDFTDRF